jgi:hypothetical protein
MFRNLQRTLAAMLLLVAVLIGGLVAASAGEGQGSGANFCGGEATGGSTSSTQAQCGPGGTTTSTTMYVTTTTAEVTTTTAEVPPITHEHECEPYICEFDQAE